MLLLNTESKETSHKDQRKGFAIPMLKKSSLKVWVQSVQ